jgi:uncharacterized protein YdhG (YjbR/CyaY superfamily)
MSAPPAQTVDEYIAAFPEPAQLAMTALRALVHEVAPMVTERISYAMPTFDLGGTPLIYFGAWKKHIGVYPVNGRVAAAFADELRGYTMGRGSLQLPLASAMPMELVRKIVAFRMTEVRGA